MQKFVRALLFAAVAGATLGGASCGSKKDDPQAQSQTAVLSGQVTPAASVATVTATDASGKTYTATVTGTGAYAFAAMTVGAYTLSFSPATGYTAPAAVAVTLGAGGTTAPAVTAALAPATATYTVDGTAMTANYIFSQGMASSSSRMLTFTANPGAAPPTVTVFLDGLLPTVGTRSLTTNANNARYMAPNYELYLSDGGAALGLPMSGTFVISAVSTSPRVFSGTFSFVGTAGSSTASPVARTITNGVFTNVPY
ncbi:MAG: carboxypeptidase regulatory-like domain-containing protein [Hymenobacter sp.]|nr:MAG: carboxypeptidase regulatory-like domain-containing protein [Hymenobacter sp.]